MFLYLRNKILTMFKFQRHPNNPILTPIKEHPWESEMVYNCAAVLKDNKVHIIYRARGKDKIDDIPISRLGYAILKEDGVTIEKRYNFPIYEPKEEFEKAGCEDPRIIEIDGTYYMLYSAFCGRNPPLHYKNQDVNIAMASTKDFFHWKRYGILLPKVLESEKNGVMFPKKIQGNYVFYYRVHPSIYVAYTKNIKHPPLKCFGHKAVFGPRKGFWDEYKIGAGPPPIETKKGWLFIYHGVKKYHGPQDRLHHSSNQKYSLKYCLGLMLIDKNNPTKILYRSKEPILTPEKEYEKEGSVPDVVFSCGSVVIKDTLFIYYGGADTTTGVATCKISEILNTIEKEL